MYSLPLAYLLWFFGGFGVLGFQRFYLGKVPTGVLWFFTGGLGFLGSIYDFFTLPRQVEEANMRRALLNGALGATRGSFNLPPTMPPGARPAEPAEPLERRILKAAQKGGGAVTPAQVALEAGCTLDEAKAQLDGMSKKGHCELRISQNGALIYVFPDFQGQGSPGAYAL